MSLTAPWTTRSRIEGIDRTRTFLPPSFGISFFRARMGRYVWVTSSSLICVRKLSAPLSSMTSNVTPSIPGAPSLLLAIRYASRSVSILQTWTYSPQKRQAGSAFAWTYRLLLRSCRLMGAFVISPLPSMLLESLHTARSLRSIRITRLRRYCGPLPTLSPSTDFPVSPVIRFLSPPISRRGEEGFSSCLAHPCHRAAAVTPPKCLAASVSLRRSMLPSPHEERLGL